MRAQRRRLTGNHCRPRIMDATRLESELPALRQRLMRQARLAVHDSAHAEDLVQDTLIAIVQQAATYRGDAALSTWAIAILRHKVADWYRSPITRRETQLPDADNAAIDAALADQFDESGHWREAVPEWQQPEHAGERRQMMQTLDGCLSCLPVQTRRVFMMREWLGFESDEIRERLGLSSDNVRTILHRARLSLRECMQRRWFSSSKDAAHTGQARAACRRQ
jgi:RNA polymerase sigma-70 factor, ECF subfamily